MVRLKFDGRSYDLDEADFGIAAETNAAELKQSLAEHLEVNETRSETCEVDRDSNGEVAVRHDRS